jgi:thymidylate synthase
MFADFPEAQNEIKRDIAELGMDVHTETMQDKDIADDPDFATKELTNYMYTVLKPDYTEIEGTHDEWVQTEWEDRLRGELNPGRAWRRRKDVWEQFLEPDRGSSSRKLPRLFSYTYSQRMGGQHIEHLVEELIRHPNSRQLYLPVWKADPDERRRGERRVPCSLGYWFVKRGGAIHETYMMRSCDFFTHYPNDAALATILLHYLAKRSKSKVGTFTHFVGSFHVYAKNVKDVF